MAEGLPEQATGIGDSRKTTETETRTTLATAYACTVPGWSIPGKIWMPTNQIRTIPAGAHASVHVRHLGVYKESRVATEPFGLGLAKV